MDRDGPPDGEPRPIAPESPESRSVFGRGREIAELAQRLAETPILLLHGMTGIGKSWLIDEIRRARPGGVAYKSVPPIRATAHLSADEIFGQLAGVLRCFDEEPRAPRQLGRLALEGLQRYRAAEPAIVHIYRAHNAFNDSGFVDIEVRAFLRGLVKQLPQFRVILESTRAAPGGLFPAEEYRVHRVRGLDGEAVRDYFRRPFPKRPERHWALTAEQAGEIYRRLGGKNPKDGAHPLGLSLLAVLADGLGLDPSRVLARHPDKLRQRLEEDLFRDLYENVLTPPQQHLLRLAALYRREIPLGHEAALDRRAGEAGAFRGLEQRFLLSADEREERFALHTLFAELARQRIVGNGAEYREDHEVIAGEWLATVRGIWSRRLPYLLAANEAAYHLLEAQAFHRLDQLSTGLLGRDTPALLESWYKRLFENDDRENQRPVLELLTALLPDEPKYHRFLGETIEKLEGRGADEALEHYFKAFALPPVMPQNLANLGRCLLARGEPERFIALVEGLGDFERAKAVNAHVDDIHSKCLERVGEGEAASGRRQQLIREGRADAPIYNDEADYLRRQRRPTEALAVLEAAERAGLMDEHSWAIKAAILEEMGRGAEASTLRRARIAAGIQHPALYNDEARYRWEDQGEPAGALAVLEAAELAGCADDHILSVKGRLLEALGRGAEASRLRRARIGAGTRNAVFYNDEAVWLRGRGEYAEALAMLARAEDNGCANEYTHTLRASIERGPNVRHRAASRPPPELPSVSPVSRD